MADDLDAAALAQGAAIVAGADVIVVCSAPDAPAPDPLPAAVADAGGQASVVVVATKADLRTADARAAVAVSSRVGWRGPDLGWGHWRLSC